MGSGGWRGVITTDLSTYAKEGKKRYFWAKSQDVDTLLVSCISHKENVSVRAVTSTLLYYLWYIFYFLCIFFSFIVCAPQNSGTTQAFFHATPQAWRLHKNGDGIFESIDLDWV